jgi:serine/threonine protein kinase
MSHPFTGTLEFVNSADEDSNRFNLPVFDSDLMALDLCRQSIAGIEYLHTRNPAVVHRDIKPSNILISRGGRGGKQLTVKIADLGLAKEADVDRTSLTMTSMGAGTLGFMAAEIVACREGEIVDGWRPSLNELKSADLFALGCVLFYIFTSGGHPFHDPRRGKRINLRRCDCAIADHDPPEMLTAAARSSGTLVLDVELIHLVGKMVVHEALQRPTIQYVAQHPLFWTPTERIRYLDDIWQRSKDDVTALNDRNLLKDRDWRQALSEVWDGNGIGTMTDPVDGTERRYRGSLSELVRFARNVKQHLRSYGQGHCVHTALLAARDSRCRNSTTASLDLSEEDRSLSSGCSHQDDARRQATEEDIAHALCQGVADLWIVLMDDLESNRL